MHTQKTLHKRRKKELLIVRFPAEKGLYLVPVKQLRAYF